MTTADDPDLDVTAVRAARPTGLRRVMRLAVAGLASITGRVSALRMPVYRRPSPGFGAPPTAVSDDDAFAAVPHPVPLGWFSRALRLPGSRSPASSVSSHHSSSSTPPDSPARSPSPVRTPADPATGVSPSSPSPRAAIGSVYDDDSGPPGLSPDSDDEPPALVEHSPVPGSITTAMTELRLNGIDYDIAGDPWSAKSASRAHSSTPWSARSTMTWPTAAPATAHGGSRRPLLCAIFCTAAHGTPLSTPTVMPPSTSGRARPVSSHSRVARRPCA